MTDIKTLPNSLDENGDLAHSHYEKWGEHITPAYGTSAHSDYDLIVVIGEGSPGPSAMPVPGMADRVELAAQIYQKQFEKGVTPPTVVFTSGRAPAEDGFTPHSVSAMNYNAVQSVIDDIDVVQPLSPSDTLRELFSVHQLCCLNPSDKNARDVWLNPTAAQQLPEDIKPHVGEGAQKRFEEIARKKSARILILCPDYHAPRVMIDAKGIFGLDQETDAPVKFNVDILAIENPYLPAEVRQKVEESEPAKCQRDEDLFARDDVETVADFTRYITMGHGIYKPEGNAFENVRKKTAETGVMPVALFSDPKDTGPAIERFVGPRLTM